MDFDDKARCDRFLAAMKAENEAASKPGGSVILPARYRRHRESHPKGLRYRLKPITAFGALQI